MATTNVYSSLYSGQNILLLNPVGQKPFYPSPIAGAYRYGLIIKPFGSLRFFAAQMALANLNPHNFAAASNMEAALGSFMGFYFRHSKILLLPPRL
jgi:hypothetical protein